MLFVKRSIKILIL